MTHAPFRGDRSIRKRIVRGFRFVENARFLNQLGRLLRRPRLDPRRFNDRSDRTERIARISRRDGIQRGRPSSSKCRGSTRVTRLRSSSLCRINCRRHLQHLGESSPKLVARPSNHELSNHSVHRFFPVYRAEHFDHASPLSARRDANAGVDAKVSAKGAPCVDGRTDRIANRRSGRVCARRDVPLRVVYFAVSRQVRKGVLHRGEVRCEALARERNAPPRSRRGVCRETRAPRAPAIFAEMARQQVSLGVEDGVKHMPRVVVRKFDAEHDSRVGVAPVHSVERRRWRRATAATRGRAKRTPRRPDRNCSAKAKTTTALVTANAKVR